MDATPNSILLADPVLIAHSIRDFGVRLVVGLASAALACWVMHGLKGGVKAVGGRTRAQRRVRALGGSALVLARRG
jgi:hypothetical protein